MAKEEERRHEQQALYGYSAQANAGIVTPSNKRVPGANAANPSRARDKAAAEEDAKQESREFSNRIWGREEVVELQEAIDKCVCLCLYLFVVVCVCVCLCVLWST